MARERDVPPFKILNNQQLLGMVGEFEEKGHISHPPRWRPVWRDSFRAAVREASGSDPATWPQQPRHKRLQLTGEEKRRIEKLCQTRDQRAQALGIESSLLGSRETLVQVVVEKDPPARSLLLPWQKQTLGLEDPVAG